MPGRMQWHQHGGQCACIQIVRAQPRQVGDHIKQQALPGEIPPGADEYPMGNEALKAPLQPLIKLTVRRHPQTILQGRHEMLKFSQFAEISGLERRR